MTSLPRVRPLRGRLHAWRVVAFALCGSLATSQPSAAVGSPGPPAARCQRAAPGAVVPEPVDFRSHDHQLVVDLSILSDVAPRGMPRYCYVLPTGEQSPTLRVSPGDEVTLRLRNLLGGTAKSPHRAIARATTRAGDPCTSGEMSPTSTNLHFHGMTVPPVCHADEVLKTSVQPGDAPFEYRFRIPDDEPPGLYWYHPHVHGFSSAQVSGGASGALVVEGLERAVPQLAGLPERVFVIRDQALENPDAPPSSAEPVVPQTPLDSDGDAGNNNTGFGKPAKDLSVNFVPVPYPDYPPATIRLKPGARQLWRVLNAAAVTYLHLALLYDHEPQPLEVVAIDGVPVNWSGPRAAPVRQVDHIGIPPGGRAEFVVTGPPRGVTGVLMTRSVDTGRGGENDPNRALANVVADDRARAPQSVMPANPKPLPPPSRPWLGSVAPVRERRLYFSEAPANPADTTSPTVFYITEEGRQPAAFDPASPTPDIVVRQGDVEDWIIENRSFELHAFHIHQLHFLLLDWFGHPVSEPFLRDTVNVPYFDLHMTRYPSVRLRMDFRDPAIVGTFVYHCHLLEHEDGGMMGTIRVLPADSPLASVAVTPGAL